MTTSTSCLSLITALALAGLSFCGPSAEAQLFKRKNARVVVDARASERFDAMKQENPDGLTFNLMEGKFYGGSMRNKELENLPSQTIAREIAERLRSQNMYLTVNNPDANLLIILSWGTTDIPPDWSEMFGEDGSSGGLGDESEDEFAEPEDTFLEDTSRDDRNRRGVSTAQLLGIDRALSSSNKMPQDYYELDEMLRDDRYFIVVQAFDFQRMRAKEGIELLWSTRFSMYANGVGFEDAYLSLARAAEPYFGQNLDDISKERTHLGAGETRMGDLEVIEAGAEE